MVSCPACRANCTDGLVFCGQCGARLTAGLVQVAAVGDTRLMGSDLRPATPTGPERVNTVVGSYRILSVLGEGGMGHVYLAEHMRLGRRVAIKMLRAEYARTPHVVKRFFDEARAVNRISHENIVEITDFVEGEEGGDNYFIMELLKGASLGDVLEEVNVLPLSRALGMAVQVCSGLAAVHDAGIVHRDLKPDNIFLTERGGQKDFVKLLDFGIAKLADVDAGGTMSLQKTAAGLIMGTPEYMAPEQACGKPVDHRADIYAFGTILYELVTGQKPFEADHFGDMVVKLTTVTPVPPSQLPGLPEVIPEDLERVILHCLAKEADDRPQRMQEVESALRDVAEAQSCELEQFTVKPRGGSGTAVIARPRTPPVRIVPPATPGAPITSPALPLSLSDVTFEGTTGRRLPWLPIAGAVALLAVGGIWLATRKGAADKPAPIASIASTAPIASPAPATKITLHFTSTPAGAEVFRVGDEQQPLGVTPLDVSYERAATPGKFELRKAGFVGVEQVVALDKDAQIAIVLAPEPTPSPPSLAGGNVQPPRDKVKRPKAPVRPIKKPSKGGKEMLDPFSND